MDGVFRAHDVDNGEVLWEEELRSSSDATPISYVSPKTGKQYVLVTVPGEGRPRPPGDHDTSGEGEETAAEPVGGRIMAYSLPD